MTAEKLSSEHLNYLVWRYLQEAGYGEAAVKLQRDWNLNPQGLPFAEYIKTHALITIVQKGLQYEALNRSITEAQAENLEDGLPQTGFFGPATPLAPLFPTQDAGGRALSPSKQPALPKRYPRENGANSSPNGLLPESASQSGIKRGRKAADAPNGTDRLTDSNVNVNGVAINGSGGGYGQPPITMSAVQSGVVGPSVPTVSSSRYRSRSPPPSITRDHDEAGEERDREELDADVDMGVNTSETTTPILQPTDGPSLGVQTWDEREGQGPGRETRSPSRPQVDPPSETLQVADGMHVTKVTFNPLDPNILVATGKQMCRVWNRRGLLSGRSSPHQYDDLPALGPGTEVTAAAWDSRGVRLAIAAWTPSEWGQIKVYDESGFLTDTLPGAQNMISALRWQPNESQLLGIAHDGTNSEVIVWDLSTEDSLAPMKSTISVIDAVWTGLNQFHACGQNKVYACRADRDIQVTASKDSDPADPEDWSYIRFSPAVSFSVTAVASADKATIWIPEHDIWCRAAHDSSITDIEFKPRPPTDPSLKDPIMLATSSTDGSIKIWRLQIPEKRIILTWTLYLGSKMPITSVAWSPEGDFIAAASGSNVLVWKLAKSRDPRLILVSNFADTKSSVWAGHGDEQDPSISWSSDGRCVAFGRGQTLSTVNVGNVRSVEPMHWSR